MTNGLAVRPITVTPPALLALHAARPDRYPALLESAATAATLGRFDILFACPGARLTLRGQHLQGYGAAGSNNRFLDALDRWWLHERTAAAAVSLPFTGGWLIYLGYELAAQVEPRLQLPQAEDSLIAQAMRIPAAIVFDHGTGSGWIIAEQESASALPLMAQDIAQVAPLQPAGSSLLQADVAEDDPERFLNAVERALGHIAAGDIYQANLSRAWSAHLNAGIRPVDLYERLRRTNPGPFCGLAVLDDLAIVSSSPERLVAVRDGWIATRPIAGTRPRGKDTLSDEQLARELHAHPKERAEHVMLVDLERNDLGRVCEAGTVQVDEFMTIESYAHVHHIVSNIRGRLRAGVTPGQALAAVFPGGTITGCPKVRCMEIIAALEATPRGAYTGSLGYLNRDGSMDFNILIRSLQVNGDRVTLRAGAGIVADSVPQRELEESRAKARGVLRALNEEAP